jgi:hypothetical protein
MQTIYLLRDPRNNEPRYVGATGHLKKRMLDHLACNDSTHRSCWIKTLKALGLKPISEILEECEGHQRVDAERAWILGFKQAGADLVNHTDGGEEMPGWTLSPEARAKMRGRKVNVTPETREKLRIAATGYRHTDEAKAKISAAGRGRRWSEETRNKISVARKGHSYHGGARKRNTEDDFWARVDKSGYCWEWLGYKSSPGGYGKLSMRSISGNNRPILAHKVAWILTNGPIVNNLMVLHKCGNPSCVNPDHLFLGTKKDRGIMMKNNGKSTTGEKSYMAKLSESKVKNIRAMSSQGVPGARIARIFDLHYSTISLIVNGKRWPKKPKT